MYIYVSVCPQVAKNLPANAGDTGVEGLIPRPGRYPEVGNGSPFQYSCLKNSTDRGAWWATVRGVTESWTQLSMSTHRNMDYRCLFESQLLILLCVYLEVKLLGHVIILF